MFITERGCVIWNSRMSLIFFPLTAGRTVLKAIAAISTIVSTWLHLNRGLLRLPGGWGSLNVNFARYDEATEMFYTILGPSMRYVLDWSDIEAFTIHTNLGQSGNPFSPHYDDFLDIWRKGDRWIVPFTRDRVYARKASLLTLKPQSNM